MVWVNLLPWRQQQQQRQLWQSLMWLAGVVALSLTVTVAVVLLAREQQQRLQQQLAAMTQAAAQAEQLVQQQQQMSRLHQQLNMQWQSYRQQQQQAQRWLLFFRELGEIMPATLWLTQLEQRAGELFFAGQSEEMTEIQQFRQRLEHQQLFSRVRQGSVIRLDNGPLQFHISASLRRIDGDE